MNEPITGIRSYHGVKGMIDAWKKSPDYYVEDDTNPIFLIDFYKFGHVDQYPKGITRVWVNFTPRSTRIEGEKGVIFFGLQRFLKKTLIGRFQKYFFDQPWEVVEAQYRLIIRKTLGIDAPRVEHIKRLHEHGKLPIDIYALPEGTYVPLGVPAMVIVNNQDWAFWIPNYLETMMSNNIWHGSTSASTALRYRKLFVKHAKLAGEKDLSFIDWMGHDFSYRGLEGEDGMRISGMGHLLAFNGTDTLPAILDAVKYYNADYDIGGSVPATEHSVMCAGGQEDETETFRRLIEDVYPSGIVSIVSDTWNLWDVLTKIVPALKDKILAREGKVVIRPDSGDPVKILIGDDDVLPYDTRGGEIKIIPPYWGALNLLYRAVGSDKDPAQAAFHPDKTLAHLNKMGLIYGDSITVDRADQILTGARRQGFSPYNFVFGIGSYTYQYVTRDTYNFAFKATAIERWVEDKIYDEDRQPSKTVRTREVQAIFKDPITDNAHKKSHRGIPIVYEEFNDADGAHFVVHETLNPTDLEQGNCALRKVFNGELLIDDTFTNIRTRVRALDGSND